MRQFTKFFTLRLLRFYQWAISPLFPPACRYVPTCSEYALEAVERYGPVRGGWMTLGRILRCVPLVCGGYDPVVKIPPAHTNSESSSASCHGAVRGNL